VTGIPPTYAQLIADARHEIATQDVRATNAMRPGFSDVCDALAVVETHLVDPEYRPADTRPEVEQ
jgi:hypothetical protein